MIFRFVSEADEVAMIAQKEIKRLYHELDKAEALRWFTAFVIGLAAFVLGFGLGIEFVIYKLGY